MNKKTNKVKTLIEATMAVVCATGFLSESVKAQKLGNNGWRKFWQGTDYFNDTATGWQWEKANRYEWQIGKRRNKSEWWGYFRPDNVNMDGSKLIIKNTWHWQKQSAGGRTYQYSGGWLESKFKNFKFGQFQANTRVEKNFADIWPTFWLVTPGRPWRTDELDVMEYQNDHLNQTHHINPGRADKRSAARKWTRWTQPQWHWSWAKERVRTNTNWAVRSISGQPPQFFINAKREDWQVKKIGPVVMNMSIVFSSSPHIKQLPNPANNYPKFFVNWVETHIP